MGANRPLSERNIQTIFHFHPRNSLYRVNCLINFTGTDFIVLECANFITLHSSPETKVNKLKPVYLGLSASLGQDPTRNMDGNIGDGGRGYVSASGTEGSGVVHVPRETALYNSFLEDCGASW